MTGAQHAATGRRGTGAGKGSGPHRRSPAPTRPDTPASTSTTADTDALDWPTSPCGGHPPFDSCGPALSATPWPAPPDREEPDSEEPLYSSARLAERSAETGRAEAATALTDLERDHAAGRRPDVEVVGEGGDNQ